MNEYIKKNQKLPKVIYEIFAESVSTDFRDQLIRELRDKGLRPSQEHQDLPVSASARLPRQAFQASLPA
jgi:hypothetical protein